MYEPGLVTAIRERAKTLDCYAVSSDGQLRVQVTTAL